MNATPTPPERFGSIADSRPTDIPWRPMSWPPPMDTVLRGNYVALAPVDPEQDSAELFAALDADAVWAHVAGRPSDAAEYARILRSGLGAGRFPWVIRLARPYAGLAAGAIVGTSSYLDVSVSDACLEIGWTAYTPVVWASGVNPECKLLLLGHAFEVLGAGRVQLKTDVRNQRSQQAIARLGAVYEGTLRRHQRRDDGTIRDTVYFSVVAEEWPDVRAGLEARLRGDPWPAIPPEQLGRRLSRAEEDDILGYGPDGA